MKFHRSQIHIRRRRRRRRHRHRIPRLCLYLLHFRRCCCLEMFPPYEMMFEYLKKRHTTSIMYITHMTTYIGNSAPSNPLCS